MERKLSIGSFGYFWYNLDTVAVIQWVFVKQKKFLLMARCFGTNIFLAFLRWTWVKNLLFLLCDNSKHVYNGCPVCWSRSNNRLTLICLFVYSRLITIKKPFLLSFVTKMYKFHWLTVYNIQFYICKNFKHWQKKFWQESSVILAKICFCTNYKVIKENFLTTKKCSEE